MSTWIIGDVHGHLSELEALLRVVHFDPADDRLVFVGDLVNGGGESLGVLRAARDLGATVCLGNHDLHMLAVWSGARRVRPKDDFHDVLESSDCAELMHWLLGQRIAWRDEELETLVVHAGLVPQWSADQAMELAAEVERALAEDHERLFENMYGNRPRRWKPEREGYERLRVLINAFTRMRTLDAKGRMDFDYSGVYSKIPPGLKAWFDHSDRQWEGTKIVFGHWSALGLRRRRNVVCIDSGVRWKGPLTAYRAEDGVTIQVPQGAR